MKKGLLVFLIAGCAMVAKADYWTQLANFPGAGRQLSSGFSIGTKGYVTCGEGGTYFNDLWEFDPALNQWTQLADLPGAPRYGAVAFTINGKGYVGTGAYPLMDDLWEYDPVTNTWAQKASITGARGFAVGFAIGFKGYIGCGMGATDFWEWDQVTDSWTQKSSCPVNRQQSVGFAINGMGYVCTGSNLNDLWQFDPVANTWLQKASLPGQGRVDAMGFVICDKGYVGSGGDGPLMDDFYEYDPVTDTWTQKANTPNGLRDDCPSFSIGQKGYFGLGDNGTYQIDFWEYTPDQCVNIPPVALFSAPNHICPGTCTAFNNLSLNATTYLWSFPGASPSTSTDMDPMNICYNTPGVYAVTLIASNPTTSDTLMLNNYITVYPYPPPQAIAQHGDTLIANQGAVSYQWFHNQVVIPGATDYFYVATEGGDYNVVATDANGCEVEAVIFDVVASVFSTQAVHGSIVYPNPVAEKLFLRHIQDDDVQSICIYNMLGEKVRIPVHAVHDQDKLSVDVGNLTRGFYWLEIKRDGKPYREKFEKQ